MKNSINIAIIGLGQIGIYLYNELRSKKKEIERKTGKKIIIAAVSAKNKNKKRIFQIQKKIFFKKPLQIFKDKKIDILFECIGLSDGISKKIVETALKNKIHVITPNKALIAKHGDSLAKLAEKNKVNLEFEASVAGGIPVLRTIYSAIGQMAETLAPKKNNKKSVVLIEYPRKGVWAVGFATKENKGEMAEKTGKNLINVFVPTTPNPTSGFLLMFPVEDVIYLNMSFEEASKFIVSAGTSTKKS